MSAGGGRHKIKRQRINEDTVDFNGDILNIVDPDGARYVNLNQSTFINDMYFVTPASLDFQIFNEPYKYPKTCPQVPVGMAVATDDYTDISSLLLDQNRFNYEKASREPLNRDQTDYKLVYGNYSYLALMSGYEKDQIHKNTYLFPNTPDGMAQAYTPEQLGTVGLPKPPY